LALERDSATSIRSFFRLFVRWYIVIFGWLHAFERAVVDSKKLRVKGRISPE
jgi:hypothetical protein